MIGQLSQRPPDHLGLLQIRSGLHGARLIGSGFHTPDAGPVFQADARAVLAGIGTAAARLDEALRHVDTLPDRVQQRTALADLAPQVGRLVDTSRSARETMLRTARLDRERDLEALHEAVAREADALHTYERTRNDLSL